MNTTSGIITLNISDLSKITKIIKNYLIILNHSLIFRVIIPEVVLIQ